MLNNENNSIYTNVEADAYVSARWNIQICQSGDLDGSQTIYPFGKKMRKNAILDNWLKSIILLFQQTQSNVNFLGGSVNMRELTKGYIQLGNGIKPISYSDTQLSSYLKESDYIRPFYGFETGFGIVESGAAVFRRSYDFLPETNNARYTEAGFRSYAASSINDNNLRNKIWSRFLFTAETGVVGFLSGYIDEGGTFKMFGHEIDHVSGVLLSGKKYFIEPSKSKRNEKITGFISGFKYTNGQFSGYNDDVRYNISGYFISGKKYNFEPITEVGVELITGFISGFCDEFGNFSGFNERSVSGVSGYFINDEIYNFNPKRYFISEPVSGFISGTIDKFNNFSGIDGGEAVVSQKVVGFWSGFSKFANPFFEFSGYTEGNNLSGYFLSGQKYYFPTGNSFSGFDGELEFNQSLGYSFTGFSFPEGSGFIGNDYPYSGAGIMTGFIGHRNIKTIESASGYFISGQKYNFPTGDGFSGFNGEEYFYNDWGYNYSGFNGINSGFSGQNIQNEKIIGYISGYLDSSGIFSGLHKLSPASGFSGYYIDNISFKFSSVDFDKFNNQRLFNPNIGYRYTGFSFPEGSGFSGIEFGDSGLCIVTGYIGDRNYYSGFGQHLSIIGDRTLLKYSGIYSEFSGEPFAKNISTKSYSSVEFFISGTSGFTGLDGTSSGFGMLTGTIGIREFFYKSGEFKAFENNQLFQKYLGYKYTGFNFPEGSVFSGVDFADSGHGIIIGVIGDRNVVNFSGQYSGLSGIPTHEYGWYYSESGFFGSGLPNFTGSFTGGSFDITLTGFSGTPFASGEKVVGFISGYINDFNNNFIPFDNINIENFTGYSGYFTDNTQKFLPTGILFSGFTGQSGFDENLKYRYTGFSFPEGSGFTGYNWPVLEKEKVTGFMSGFMTPLQQFIPFQNLYPELQSSGYFIDGQQRFFKTGEYFSGFIGEPNIEYDKYEYSGFFIDNSSAFSGIEFLNSGTGMLTGIIGYKNNLTYPISGSGMITGYIGDRNVLKYSNTGILTGIIGNKDYISGINLEYGQFIRITYEVLFRIPMLTGETLVTGNNLVNGNFNTSGRLKLVGRHEYIFGYWNMINGGRSTESPFLEGFWWPSNPVHCFRDWKTFNPPCPYARTHLSANLIASGYDQFPPNNQVRSLQAVTFGSDEGGCSTVVQRGPNCNFAPQDYAVPILKQAKWGTWPAASPESRSEPIYPVISNGLLKETYSTNTKPTFIDIKIIFPAEYPNNDVAINGIYISAMTDECVLCDGANRCSDQYVKPVSPDPEWLKYPCDTGWTPDKGDYHVWKNEDIPASTKSSYGISGRQGIGWAYIFDKPQMKYEDQKIEIDFRFSLTRDFI